MKQIKSSVLRLKSEALIFQKMSAALFFLLYAENASAAGGLDGVKSIIQKVVDALDTISLIVVTLAFIIAGYKVVFGGRTIQEVVPILIGGVIIGAAGYLASLVLGK